MLAENPFYNDLMTIRPAVTAFWRLIWIGSCALALLLQTRLMVGLPTVPGWLDGFVFGSTVFGYHCTHPRRVCRWLAWGLGAGGGFCFLWLDQATQFSALGPACLWVAYYGLRRPGTTGLRALPVAKPLVIALAWTWVTLWLPTGQPLWPIFLARTAFILALALAYDLTDLAYDRRYQLTTLVGRMGEQRSLRLIMAALTFAALTIGLGFFQKIISLPVTGAIWATYLFTALALPRILRSWSAVTAQKVAIDALMILQALLVWLAV